MRRPIAFKSPEGSFPIELEYQAPDLAAGETISSAVVTASPAGLTIGTPIIGTNTVGVLISIGSKGVDYIVRFKVTTSVGYIYNHPELDSILVKVI